MPLYKTIQEETNELRINFTTHANLYYFPGTQDILEKIEQIEVVYRKKVLEQSKEADSLRLDQISFIHHVTNDLKQDLRSKDELVRLGAERALLGVVIHRYLRLVDSYNPKFEVSIVGAMTFFASKVAYKDVSSCELHNTLLELFGFAKLEPYTILLCCNALQNYLMLERSKGRYAYINKDADFFERLNDLIKDAKANIIALAKVPIETQLDYISYIESMGVALSTTDEEVANFIERLSKLIKIRLEALAEERHIDRETLFEDLDTLNPSPTIRLIFEDFVPDLVITKNGEMHTKNSEGEWKVDGEFQKVLSTCLAVHSKNTLLGAYLLCLSQSNEDTPHLRLALCSAIGITSLNPLNKEREADKAIIIKALDHLKRFMRRGVTDKVKFTVWGNEDEMTRALTQLKGSYESETMSLAL